LIFAGLRRVAEDPGAALNPAAIDYAYARGWLSAWERDFAHDTCRKRSLSPRQMAKRHEVNRRVARRWGAPTSAAVTSGPHTQTRTHAMPTSPPPPCRCGRQHRGWRTFARCRFPKALWVCGEGRYGSLSRCHPGVSLELHASYDGALAAK